MTLGKSFKYPWVFFIYNEICIRSGLLSAALDPIMNMQNFCPNPVCAFVVNDMPLCLRKIQQFDERWVIEGKGKQNVGLLLKRHLRAALRGLINKHGEKMTVTIISL